MTLKPSTKSALELGCGSLVAFLLVGSVAYAVYRVIKAIVDSLVMSGS